jgi:DNA-binding transcriptional regulator YiaG
VSTRTIVEINHDHLDWAQEHPQTFGELIYEVLLKTYRGAEDAARQRGIRVLASRHHTNALKIEVEGLVLHEECE